MKSGGEEPSILVGFFEEVVWIKVRTKGSVQCSPGLRAFIDQLITTGHSHVIIDLEDCPGMDSTFMGTLTGISLKLRKQPGGTLDILNAGDRNLQSLRELGLDHVLSVDINGCLWPKERRLVSDNVTVRVPSPPVDSRTCRDVVADAHEALCEVNAENIPRFRDVLEFLSESPPPS